MRRREAFRLAAGGLRGGAAGGAGRRGRRAGRSGRCGACRRRRSRTCARSPPRPPGCGSSWSRSRPTRTGSTATAAPHSRSGPTSSPPRWSATSSPSSSASPRTGSRTPGRPSTRARTGGTAPSSTTRSAASTWRCGTSRGGRPGCPCTSCSAGRPARRWTATRTRAAPRSRRCSTTPARTWPGASGTCACRWASPAWPATARGAAKAAVTALHSAPVFEPAAYMRRALQLLEAARKELGDEVELLHDVHERVSPTQALGFCKDVERFRLFFLEDPVSPEDIGWFRLIRQQCATPLAMGELFNSPHEWVPLISERLIDYIRVHVSQAGGLTPCRKMAALAEAFGVKTAWHGPGDVSPVGHACNIALDLACANFGIQESSHVQRRDARGLLGLPRAQGRLLLRERGARLGHRGRRARGGEVPVRPRGAGRAAAAERRLGRDPPAGRHASSSSSRRARHRHRSGGGYVSGVPLTSLTAT